MGEICPSAGNQILFRIHLKNVELSISSEPGFLEQADIGIAKVHFETGAGPK